MKLELLWLGLVLGGCGIQNEGLDLSDFDPDDFPGDGPGGGPGGGGISCPQVEFPQAVFVHLEDDFDGPAVHRIALGGLYELGLSQSTRPVAITAHGGVSVEATGTRGATLRGDEPGQASIVLTASGGNHACDRTVDFALEVTQATNITLVPPRYTRLGDRSIVFFDDETERDVAVRISDKSGESLVDTTLAIGGTGVTQTRFDRFSLVGETTVEVEAESFGFREIAVETESAIDRVELVHATVDDPAFPHRVCAHALRGDREVAVTWDITLEGVFPLLPNRNCVAISQANVPVRVVATAVDGKSAFLDVR